MTKFFSRHRPCRLVVNLGSRHTMCMMVAPAEDEDTPEILLHKKILGLAIDDSKGIRAGVVTDHRAANRVVGETIRKVFRQVGFGVKDVFLMADGGNPQTKRVEVSINIAGDKVNASHLALLARKGQAVSAPAGRCLIYIEKLGYYLDGKPLEGNISGASGHLLRLSLNLVHADRRSVLNNLLVLRSCGLRVQCYIPPVLALFRLYRKSPSFLGLIDMGAEVTSFAFFKERRLIELWTVETGGNQITHIIADSLGKSFAGAEALKHEFGFATGGFSGLPRASGISPVSAGKPQSEDLAIRALIPQIVTPRLEEIFMALKERCALSEFREIPDYNIMIAGGAGLTAGIGPIATRILNRNLFPFRISGPASLSEKWPSHIWAGGSGLFELIKESKPLPLPGQGFFQGIFPALWHQPV